VFNHITSNKFENSEQRKAPFGIWAREEKHREINQFSPWRNTAKSRRPCILNGKQSIQVAAMKGTMWLKRKERLGGKGTATGRFKSVRSWCLGNFNCMSTCIPVRHSLSTHPAGQTLESLE
jgi:hypothetical protein